MNRTPSGLGFMLSLARLICCVGQKRYLTGKLDRPGQHALMLGGRASDSPRDDFSALGYVMFKHADVFVIDVDWPNRFAVRTESTFDLLFQS